MVRFISAGCSTLYLQISFTETQCALTPLWLQSLKITGGKWCHRLPSLIHITWFHSFALDVLKYGCIFPYTRKNLV